MTDLPATWASAKFSDFGTWIGGGTPSKANPRFWDGSIPWVSPKDMKSKIIRETIDGITKEAVDNSAAKLVPAGSVLIVTRSGILAHTLPIAVTAVESTLNQDLKALTLPPGIASDYIAWGMRAFEQRILDKCRKGGTTVHSIEMPRLASFELPIAPTNEQCRIVEKIEALFDEIDKGVESLRTARTTLGLYRQSLLKSAFEGRLTADWRAQNADKLEAPETLLARIQSERDARYKAALYEWQDALAEWRAGGEKGKRPAKPKRTNSPAPLAPEQLLKLPKLPKGWLHTKIGDLAQIGTGATPLKSNQAFYTPPEIPWVTSAVVNDAYVNAPEQHVSALALEKTNLQLYPSGTLLLAMYGEGKTRGKCAELRFASTTNQALAALQVEQVFPQLKSYLKRFLLKNYHDMRLLSSGGVQPNLNLGIVENHWVPICSPSEQAEIVRRLDARLEAADAMEAEINAALTRSAALRQSILKKAFSGRLVPQDPADEPAATLLARIKAERARASKTARKRKTPA